MTAQEFSNQFDVLYNNITSNQAPGLSEYEKSVFLTKAEIETVKNHFTATSKGNDLGQGFDDSAKRQADFSCLMKTDKCAPLIDNAYKTIYTFTYNNSSPSITLEASDTVYALVISDDGKAIDPLKKPVPAPKSYTIDNESVNPTKDTFEASASGITLEFHGVLSKIYYTTQGAGNNSITVNTKEVKVFDKDLVIDPRSGVYSFPSDVFITINEAITTAKGEHLQVIPLRYDEYTRLMSKPYKRPLKYQAWRLNSYGNNIANTSNKYVEIVIGPNDNVETYIVRYIRIPKPIIIGDLDGLTINGYVYTGCGGGIPTEGCELDPILHEEILQRAVELAKVAWDGSVQTVAQAGQRSE